MDLLALGIWERQLAGVQLGVGAGGQTRWIVAVASVLFVVRLEAPEKLQGGRFFVSVTHKSLGGPCSPADF